MTTIDERPGTRPSTWLNPDDCSLPDLRALVEVTSDRRDYPYAADVVDNVPVYDCDRLRTEITTLEGRRRVQSELAFALDDGPGLVVFAGAFPDTSVVDRVTDVFFEIIADQHAQGQPAGDHYAKPGANDRIWNALEKLALRDPDAFVEYYANEIIELMSAAWLGPNFQITSQVNVVNPGGEAQVPHRDYHLGFQTVEVAQQFPAHAHRLSALLTLQGAVAHTEMPVESGPTMYLPYSHQYAPGYLAWRQPEFREFFSRRYVQLPLAKGDVVFFNPALFHGAGTNTSADVQRMANLLQVSSAFGRAMETVDRVKTAKAIYPVLQARRAAGLDRQSLRNAINCAAEGYPFPTNLDRDENVGGLSPLAQTALLEQALHEHWDADQVAQALDAYATRHRTDEI